MYMEILLQFIFSFFGKQTAAVLRKMKELEEAEKKDFGIINGLNV
jgi:hypothetical protein